MDKNKGVFQKSQKVEKTQVMDKKIPIEKNAHNFFIWYPILERKNPLKLWQQEFSNNVLLPKLML